MSKVLTFIRTGLAVCALIIATNNLSAKSLKANISQSLDYEQSAEHAFDASSIIEKGVNEEIDTFNGYLKVTRNDIHLPGNNGMDINVTSTYTGSRLNKQEFRHHFGYGWQMNSMKIKFFTDWIQKKKKNYIHNVIDPDRTRPHRNHYGNFPLSAMVEFPDGSTKILNITKFNPQEVHNKKTKYYYAYWPEEGMSTDGWRFSYPINNNEVYLYSPDGKKYTFSVLINRKSFNLIATLIHIEDVYGNWIHYDYEHIPHEIDYLSEDFLKTITSSDGRKVDFNYKELKTKDKYILKVLDTVSVNNKIWRYEYELTHFKHSTNNEIPVLSKVIRADGSTWEYKYGQSTKNSRLLTKIKTPNDLVTFYDYKYHKKDDKDFEQIATKHTYDENNNLINSISYKINKDNLFICQEHQDFNCIKNSIHHDNVRVDYTYVTTESKNKNNKIRVFSPIWSHGLIISKEIHDESLNESTLVEKTDYKWAGQQISENKLYFDRKRRDETYNRPVLVSQKIFKDKTFYSTEFKNPDNCGRAQEILEIGPSGEKKTELQYKECLQVDSPITFNVSDLIIFQKDENNIIKYKYDSYGKIIEQNSNNFTNKYLYNLDGSLASSIDSLGNRTLYSNYFRGIPQLITFPDNTFEEKQIDYFGNLLSYTDANFNTTKYSYDLLNRIVNIYPAKGLQTNIIYNKNSIITQKGSYKEIVQKNALGNILSNIKFNNYELLTKEDYKYDSFGREIFKSVPYKGLSSTDGVYKTYDALNRVRIIRTQFENQNIETYYNYLPNSAIENINPKGHRELIYYQAYGSPSYKNPIKIINTNNIETVINRSKDGLIENIKRGNITKYYKYNSSRLLSEYIEPETCSTLYNYDANGNLISKTNANNQTIQNKYNNKNKLISTSYNDNSPAKYFTYDNNGNLISAKTQDNEWIYKYDSNNNLTNANFIYKDKIFNFEYRYNNLNYLESIIYPSKKEIKFNPNILGQVSQIGDFVKDIQYTTKGDIISYNYANGVRFNKIINSRYLPENFSYQLNNKNININYTYDILNNITKIIHPNNTVLNLGYDNQDRLASVSGLNINGDIQYDKFDNILKNSITDSFYSYDVNNRLVSTVSNNTQNFSYDNAGRVINDGLHSYAYSPEDKLISVDDVKYSYDAHGNKISNGESLFIHNKLGQKLLDITDNKYSEYFYLGNLLIAKTEKDLKNNQGKTNYYHNDLLGSVIASSDENGNVISETLHLPFGLEANNINNNSDEKADKEISYTGKYKDKKSGLYDFSARHYDAKIGRFTTPDPITFTPKNLVSFNRYAYGNNNPYKYVDPDGENPVQIFGYLAVRAGFIIYGAYEGYMEQGLKLAVTKSVLNAFAFSSTAKAVSIISKVLPKYFIRTPYGIARQSFSLKNLKLRKEVKSGKSLYRQGEFDIQNTQDAQFWSAENPLQLRNYADKYGMPEGDGINWVMKGTIDKETPFVTRDAPGIGSNAGGGSEIVLNSGQVKIQWFHML